MNEFTTRLNKVMSRKLESKLQDEGMSQSEYLLNLIMDDLSGEEPDTCEHELMDVIDQTKFNKNEVAELFIILAHKMDSHERKLAQRLLDKFPILEKSKGIYTEPKEVEPRRERQLDNEGVNNFAAANVSEEQPQMDEDDPALDIVRDARSGKHEFEDVIDDIEDDLEPDIIENNKNNDTSSEVESVSKDDDDVDSNVPGWAGEDEHGTFPDVSKGFISNEESEKVIAEHIGLSKPVRAKRAKKLKYDPDDPNINKAQTPVGKYAKISKRTKIRADQVNVQHGKNFLKDIGVSESQVDSTVKVR